MSVATDGILDRGLTEHRLKIIGHADPSNETSISVPPATLATVMGVDHKDPCLLGSLAHTLSYDSVEAPFPLGVITKAGETALGDGPKHHIISEHESGGYHIVASKGKNDFSASPVQIDIAHTGNVHQNVMQMIKRGARWRDDVGKTADQLIAGLEEHTGTAADGKQVSRMLVPVDGDHPCSRALRLNADAASGPYSQYSKKHRKLIKVGGADHIIVETEHLKHMAQTLQSNLASSTHIGKHGITFKFKPLPGVHPSKHAAGKVVLDVRIHKSRASDVIEKGAEFTHGMGSGAMTQGQARAVLDGGGSPDAAANPKEAQTNIKEAILGAKLTPASGPLPSIPAVDGPGVQAGTRGMGGGDSDDDDGED